MKKYYLVEDLGGGDYKKIDASRSKTTIKNLQKLQKRVYSKDYKIIVLNE